MINDNELERELVQQRDSFLYEYERERKRKVKKGEDSMVWQDLPKAIDEKEKERKKSEEE